MAVTADTSSHFDRSWLKAEARENMDPMAVTADTSFNFDRSWLKVDARENMGPMSAGTSHFDRSWLEQFVAKHTRR